MKIGIFGTHSSGKTTLLEDLRTNPVLLNYKVFTGTTRALQTQGTSINEDGDSAGQAAIFDARLANLDSDYFIADRTIADVLAYSEYLFSQGRVSIEELDRQRQIVADRISEYDLIIYLRPEFDLVEDGVRSKDVQFRDDIADIMENIYKEYVHPVAHIELRGTPTERANDALEAITTIKDSIAPFPKIIFHESPISMMNMVDKAHGTMESYFLVHLFEEYPEYLEYAKESSAKGNLNILDNSMFELGESFDPELFVKYINEVNPALYIVPDVFQDKDATLRALYDWNAKHRSNIEPESRSRSMGVIQGKTFEELIECYKEMEPKVNAIAIPFRSACFELALADPNSDEALKYAAKQRILFIEALFESGVVNMDKYHHLLGCTYYKEFSAYRNHNWICSVDTSSPIMHGILNVPYDDIARKPAAKMHTLMGKSVTELASENYHESERDMMYKIAYNIETFRRAANEDVTYVY